jgi:peptidoglycan/LPS O-acetylase OafA/YrhL
VLGSEKDFRDVSASVPMVLFYVANWFVGAGKFPDEWFLGHCWSLAVEEQFYLVWPLVLVGLLKVMSRRGLVWVAGAGFLVASCWRAYLWLSRLDANRIYFGSDTNADALLAGVFVAALVTRWKPSGVRALYAAGVLIVLAIPVAMLKLIHYGPVVLVLYAGGLPAIEALVGVLILALLFTPLRTLLEARWLAWVGRVSYGLYLWHIPALAWARRALPVGWSELAGITATFLIATASFYALEKPVLRYKNRFQWHTPK